MIIGITGPIGSGKDTVAALLAAIGVTPVAFADALRHEVGEAYALTSHDMAWFGQRNNKELPFAQLSPARCHDEGFANVLSRLEHHGTKPMSLRDVLRLWGTEYRRRQRPNYWIERMHNHIAYLGAPTVVIPDVRFDDEAQYVREHGVLVHLERPRNPYAAATSTHASDRPLPVQDRDLIVRNGGSLAELAVDVFDTLRHHLPGGTHG